MRHQIRQNKEHKEQKQASPSILFYDDEVMSHLHGYMQLKGTSSIVHATKIQQKGTDVMQMIHQRQKKTTISLMENERQLAKQTVEIDNGTPLRITPIQ